MKETNNKKSAPMNEKELRNLMFAFTKKNYILLSIGVIFIITGIFTMQGGKMQDLSMFDSQRTILSPILIMIGFIINIFAILSSKWK